MDQITQAPQGDISVDTAKVMQILLRDNPKEVERAMLLVRIEDLTSQNKELLDLVNAPATVQAVPS